MTLTVKTRYKIGSLISIYFFGGQNLTTYLHNWTNKYLLNNEKCRHLLLQPEFYRVHRHQRTDFRNSAQKSSRLRLMTLIGLNSYLINWSEGSEIPQLVGILSHRLTSWFPVLFKNIFWPFLMRRQTHDIDNWFDLLEFWRTSNRNRTLVDVACSTRPWSDYIIVTMMTIQRINRSKIKIELRITRWIHTSQILHTFFWYDTNLKIYLSFSLLIAHFGKLAIETNSEINWAYHFIH